MEQAIERVTRSIEGYQTGQIARSIATIELVSAFKVVSRNLSTDAENLKAAVAHYIEAVLSQVDAKQLTGEGAVTELTRVYAAAHRDDPDILTYMTDRA